MTPLGRTTGQFDQPSGNEQTCCPDGLSHQWTPWYGGPLQEHRWCENCDLTESR